MTYGLFDEWLSVVEIEQEDNMILAIMRLLDRLPQINFDVLKLLVPFWHKVTLYENRNKMGVLALATVISPNLLWGQHTSIFDFRAMHNTNELGRVLIGRSPTFFPPDTNNTSTPTSTTTLSPRLNRHAGAAIMPMPPPNYTPMSAPPMLHPQQSAEAVYEYPPIRYPNTNATAPTVYGTSLISSPRQSPNILTPLSPTSAPALAIPIVIPAYPPSFNAAVPPPPPPPLNARLNRK